MNDAIPEIMRKLRVTVNYSQEYVSEQIGISLSTYSRYERGETEIDLSVAKKLADLYKLTIDQFIHYNEYKATSYKEPEEAYSARLKVPITVSLDGTEETLQLWFKKLTAINQAI